MWTKRRYYKCGQSVDHYKDIDAEKGEVIKTSLRKWLTTKVIDHFELCHPQHEIAFPRLQRKGMRLMGRVATMAENTQLERLS